MTNMLNGSIAMASFVIAMFFLHYWKRTKDRFFVLFCISFLIQSFNRVLLVELPEASESSALFCSIRLLAYLLILFAILDKNRMNSPQK